MTETRAAGEAPGVAAPPQRLDRNEAERFIAALTTSSATPLTFQTFDDNKTLGHSKIAGLSRILHGTLASCWEDLAKLNELGAGVFVMVNEGTGLGRDNAQVRALRALFIDDDSGALAPQALAPAPTIVVQSKAGVQVYWRLKADERLEDFTPAQAALSLAYRTDNKVKDLARVMRLPGFLHKKDPASAFLVHVVQTADVPVYSIAAVLAAAPKPLASEVPPPHRSSSASLPARGQPLDQVRRRASAYLATLPGAVSGEAGHDRTWAAALKVVRGFRLSETAAFDLLWSEYNPRCTPEWSERELRHKICDVTTKSTLPWGFLLDAERRPRPGALPEDPQMGSAQDQRALAGDLDAVCAKLLCNDVGNGQRLLHRHGRALRYCHPWSKWLVYDGVRWRVDDAGSADARAKNAALAIFSEAAATPAFEDKERLSKWAQKSCARDRVSAMLAMAQSEPGVPVLPCELDRGSFLLNVLNGTVDLRTGQLRSHHREDLLTKLAPVEFRSEATCPTWEAFLRRVAGADEALISFLQRATGYALTGDVGADAFLLLHGGGANGKSTFLNVLRQLLGDYAVVLPPELLLEARGERHSTDKTLLHGARLAICQEVKEGRRFDMGAVKALTGRDPVTARRMREDNWTFVPTHKLWLAANSKPRVPENDEAAWRRILLAPFEVTIPEAERDAGLPDRLAAELPGILAWAVRGCLDWQAAGAGLAGLGLPPRVREATASYREQEDVLGTFLEDYCIRADEARVEPPDLYSAFYRWCTANKEPPLDKRDFNARVEQLSRVVKKKIRGDRWWFGIGLKAAPVQGELVREVARA